MRAYNALYNWYYLPATVHKVLMHGAEIIESMVLPIGQLSEEVAEASIKVIRKTQTEHTRNISRLSTNKDLIHMSLTNSDPLISSMWKKKKKRPTGL